MTKMSAILEVVEDEHGELIRCDGIEWRGYVAVTPDGYRVQLGQAGDPPLVVIRICPPWHKPFYSSTTRVDAPVIAARLIEQHRAQVGNIPHTNSHGNAFIH